MTRADQSYFSWYLDRNGCPATDHAMHRVPYVCGYEAGEADLRARLIDAVKTALDRDKSMERVIELTRDI